MTALSGEQSQQDVLRRQLRKVEDRGSVLEHETDQQSSETDRLDAQLEAVRKEAGLSRPDSKQTAAVEIPEGLRPSAREVAKILARMPDLSRAIKLPDAEHGWDAYLREVELYIDRHGIEVNRDPIAQLLPPHRAAEICRRFEDDFGPSPWDRMLQCQIHATETVSGCGKALRLGLIDIDYVRETCRVCSAR